MNKIVILLTALLVGCSTFRHPNFSEGTVFLGREYRGEGIYLFTQDRSAVTTTNAFMTLTNVMTNVTFSVIVANGYSRPVLLQTRPGIFRDVRSSMRFYNTDGEILGRAYWGTGQHSDPRGGSYEYLGAQPGRFCECHSIHVFDYTEHLILTDPVRPRQPTATPTGSENEQRIVPFGRVPMNTTLIEMDVPVEVSYYVLGDATRYSKFLWLHLLVNR